MKVLAYKLDIKINDLPKRINQTSGKHWAVRHKESQKWKHLVQLAARYNFPHEPLKRANVTFIRHSSKSPDFDNIVHSFKVVMDALKKLEIIEDDNMNVVGQPTYSWEKAEEKKGFIRVVVEEIEIKESCLKQEALGQ